MKKIVPHLWFDKEAKEAAEFYASVFPNSSVKNVSTLHDTPSGDADVVSFELMGSPFMAISAGPYFKFTPAISFTVPCKTKDEVDAIYGKLAEGGKPLMPLDTYPFSERYGWIQDKYALTWQVILAGEGIAQSITPHLMFVNKVAGKAEEAINFYTSVFHTSKVLSISRYPAGMEPEKEGTVVHALFQLEGQEFGALDSANEHKFNFNEAISLMINCKDQAEIDYYWGKLSSVPEAEQCGWLKDKYGVSWQVVPEKMGELMSGDKEKLARVTQAFLKMKKFDLAELERVARG